MVIEAPDIIFEHNHFLKSGRQPDETYQRQNSPERYHEGKKILDMLRVGNDWSSVPGFFNFWFFYDMIARRLKDGEMAAEIGVWLGRSIIYLAQTCQRLGKYIRFIAVDNFHGEKDQPEHKTTVDANGGNIRAAFEANISRCGVAERVQIIEGDSSKSADVPDGMLAFAFIDAAHDYDSVRADIAAWLPKVKPGGILAGHDIQHEPVKRAVHDALGDKVKETGPVWFLEIK
jgi:predicted O-methyltransferase YrrM